MLHNLSMLQVSGVPRARRKSNSYLEGSVHRLSALVQSRCCCAKMSMQTEVFGDRNAC